MCGGLLLMTPRRTSAFAFALLCALSLLHFALLRESSAVNCRVNCYALFASHLFSTYFSFTFTLHLHKCLAFFSCCFILCINKYNFLSHFFTNLCIYHSLYMSTFLSALFLHFFAFLCFLYVCVYMYVYMLFANFIQPSIKWLNTSRWTLCATNTDSCYERSEDTRITLPLSLLLCFSIGGNASSSSRRFSFRLVATRHTILHLVTAIQRDTYTHNL